MTLDTVETPAAVVDLPRVRANLERVAAYCAEHGIAWRPHVKTHKSVRFARMQLEAGAQGLTVATPFEAEVMSQVVDDILMVYPPVGAERIRRLLDLPDHVRLGVALDSTEALEPLARAAADAGRTVRILVEVDVGAGRVGVGSSTEAIRVARRAQDLAGVAYDGLAYYPGHMRVPHSEQSHEVTRLRHRIERFVSDLDGAGLAPSVVSGGSTPTLYHSHEMGPVTEIRPGTCIFQDRDVHGMGVASWDELAYTVLATVVSTAVPGRAAIDAGSKALSKEPFRSGGAGFGVLLDRPEVMVVSVSEEHGVLDLTNTSWEPEVGDRVRVVPNHVCLSVNLQDRLLVSANGGLESWPVDARGRGLAP